jgi:glycosyltransferase involved in cell wall biosynthesis
MSYNIRIVSTYPPRKCGIGTFSRNLADALKHFTGEVGHIRVAAIDKDGLPYNIPVDLVIDQYHPQSWHKAGNDIIERAKESTNPTVVLLQHEYGLDPNKDGEDSKGTNFVETAKTFHKQALLTFVYLHTVLNNPNEHQRKVLQDLASNSDGILVTTESAVDMLKSSAYGIKESKIKHIDHGIRMQNPSQYDRLAIKKEYGLENQLLVTTLGLHSPGKGLQYSIRAYAKFLNESFTKAQREKIVYLIAGPCHPEFVKVEGGKLYREYDATLNQALKDSELKWCKVKDISEADFGACDVIFLDTFLDERTLLNLYGATNVMLLPYLDMQQISSGILADTVGSGRVPIATKFKYALELIGHPTPVPDGIIIGPHARGVLVDPGEASIEQIAQGLDYLVFNRRKRLGMEKRVHSRGYQMRWDNTAWQLLQYAEFIKEEGEIVTGRGIEFARKKRSVFQKGTTELGMKL